MIAYAIAHSQEIESARSAAKKWAKNQLVFAYNYQLDEKQVDQIRFKGYEAIYPEHPVTGLKQLGYDQTQPYEKYIPYYNHYLAKDSTSVPKYYIVSGQETAIIERLKINQVEFTRVNASTATQMKVSCFIVKDYKAPSKPYEGHFKLQNLQVGKQLITLELKPGDILISCSQEKANFIHAVLQPLTEDSYLTWNFFDSYLQQKEYFSPYVFKEQIAEILEAQPKLKEAYDTRKRLDLKFANDEWEQLYFIYQNSPYFEPSFMRLPVYEVY
jgi:hypothetical protein